MRDVYYSNKASILIMTAISPIFAAIAIYSLFTPWVSGKLLVVGKTITGFDFPNVFWSVLIGCLAIIFVYVQSLILGDVIKRRGAIFALSAATLLASGYFLYVYSKKPSIPGIKVSLHGGLLLCFVSMMLAAASSVIPLNLFLPQKQKDTASKIDKPKQNQVDNPIK